MKIHEYQAKGILKKYGVAVPRGEVAETAEQAEAAAQHLFGAGASGVVVKAQIHAGGRGKGGGVKIAKSVKEAGEIAAKMLGMKLVTHQTGPEGRIVRRLLIEETLPIEKELYLGIVIDRTEARPVFMASAKPTISSTVSPFICRATSKAAICASVHLPARICDMTSRASSRESDLRWLAMRWRAWRIMGRV